MKVSLDSGLAIRIHGYEKDSITLSGLPSSSGFDGSDYDAETSLTTFRHSLLLDASGRVEPWAVHTLHANGEIDLLPLLSFQAEIILIGTGNRQVFPRTDQLLPLQTKQLGVEIMSTPAACRTYNILAAEGRQVAAALLVEKVTT